MKCDYMEPLTHFKYEKRPAALLMNKNKREIIMQFLIRAYDGEGKLDSRKELDDYIANEPYVVEEVWEKIEIEQINVVIANSLDK